MPSENGISVWNIYSAVFSFFFGAFFWGFSADSPEAVGLISLRRAAFPRRFLINPMCLRRTRNLRRTTIFWIYGEWIGKTFSIPTPSSSERTVILRLIGDDPWTVIISHRNIWVRSFDHSLIIWWTSTSIPVSSSGRSCFRKSHCIAEISWESDINILKILK